MVATSWAVVLLSCVAACGGAPPPPPPPPPPAPPPHVTRVPVEDTEPEEGVTIIHAHGYMEKDAIDAWLQPHQRDLMDCYLKQVHGKRWLGGHVKLHWDIKKDGTISAVKLMAESDLGARSVEQCLLEARARSGVRQASRWRRGLRHPARLQADRHGDAVG